MANPPSRKMGAVVRGLCSADGGASDEVSERIPIAHAASGRDKPALHDGATAALP